MIKDELITKLSGFFLFERWHPEIALRYLPIVKEIRDSGVETLKILEVGSGGLGIAPYLKKPVTGVDINFRPPYFPLLKRVKASVTKLPFDNKTFDIVLSVDMLEHLDSYKRGRAIDEMVRVAREKVLIGVPCGEFSHRQDKVLYDYFKLHLGKSYDFFEEQIGFGLPDKEEIEKMISKSAKKFRREISLIIKGNENLKMRNFLMKGWMTENPLKNFFFRKIMLFFIQFLLILDKEPFYRQLFFVKIKENESSN
ncbi:methyltransferase domain-containing protein [Patescibacteria group bacterium]|nr:methyltransferase domain-containing protein [Patescibacteria group bacterium]MCL5798469.1 methyltransferase domain-containing protein [Patescibacteria group bacterium]